MFSKSACVCLSASYPVYLAMVDLSTSVMTLMTVVSFFLVISHSGASTYYRTWVCYDIRG